MEIDEGNAGAALGGTGSAGGNGNKPVQESLFEEGIEEGRRRLESGATKKRGKHFGSDHGNTRKSTEEKGVVD